MPQFLPILKRPLPALRQLIRDRRGAAAIMLAIALSGIVGFAGLGTEVAAWYFTTRSMQGAASSAAASAAAELAAATVAGSSITNDQLQHTGRAVSATFNFSNGVSGVVNAQAAYVVGNINGTVNTATGYGTYTGVNPTVDPYASVAVPSSSTTCGGWTPNGNNSLHLSTATDTATLYPSSAGGTCAIPHDIQLSGGTLNLCPGVYVFNSGSNLTLTANAIVNAPPQAGPIPPATTPPMSSTVCPNDTSGGVTIVFVNSSGNPGAPSISGTPTVNMVAPTSGTTSGIAIFQQRTICTGNGNC